MKSIEIEIKKKKNFQLVRSIFSNWCSKVPRNIQEISEVRVVKRESNSALSNSFMNPDSFQMLNEYQHGNEESYAATLPYRASKEYDYPLKMNEIRQPYHSKIKTLDSEEERIRQVNLMENQEIKKESQIFVNDLIKSIQITNHKEKQIMREVLDEDKYELPESLVDRPSYSNISRGSTEYAHSQMRLTVDLEIDSERRIEILRKIYLKWYIYTQNVKMDKIKQRFQRLCDKSDVSIKEKAATQSENYYYPCTKVKSLKNSESMCTNENFNTQNIVTDPKYHTSLFDASKKKIKKQKSKKNVKPKPQKKHKSIAFFSCLL
jgi:hypothetical protein